MAKEQKYLARSVVLIVLTNLQILKEIVAMTVKTFSVRVGTIFDDSKIELQKWFMVIYLLNSSKKGIPSTQVAKEIDVTQSEIRTFTIL